MNSRVSVGAGAARGAGPDGGAGGPPDAPSCSAAVLGGGAADCHPFASVPGRGGRDSWSWSPCRGVGPQLPAGLSRADFGCVSTWRPPTRPCCQRSLPAWKTREDRGRRCVRSARRAVCRVNRRPCGHRGPRHCRQSRPQPDRNALKVPGGGVCSYGAGAMAKKSWQRFRPGPDECVTTDGSRATTRRTTGKAAVSGRFVRVPLHDRRAVALTAHLVALPDGLLPNRDLQETLELRLVEPFRRALDAGVRPRRPSARRPWSGGGPW